MTDNLAIESADIEIEAVEIQDENQASNEVEQETDASQEVDKPEGEDLGNKEEWPDKFANALHRKTKQLNKTRAQLQEERSRIKELEAKLNDLNTKTIEAKVVNADDFETMDAYLKAQMDALVETRLKQANSETEKAQITQEQKRLIDERDSYIATQAQEVSKSIPDFTQTIQPHLQVLDALPNEVADIFYSMENAPLAAYVLAKEGKLAHLPYANPYVAASEIMSAHERGKAMLNKPQRVAVSNAPEPMMAARGTVKTTKDFMKGDVLKNLGLK